MTDVTPDTRRLPSGYAVRCRRATVPTIVINPPLHAPVNPNARHARAHDKSLRETLLEAGMIRFKPIVLTAAAAMIGAAVILTDPIFQGLAISLLFGLASSTLLTVLVIPAIYIVLRDDEIESGEQLS